MTHRWQTQLWLIMVLTGGFFAAPAPSLGQPVPDETLGAENSRVRRATVRGREADLIEGGATRGSNLFHSFREFGVREGDAAYFANPADIENIFSRVTGNTPSNILGVLGVDGTANLFFMNPNGILFGPNASLDVGGSFVGTTANAIGFGEAGFFSATNPEVPSQVLTVNPSAFFFNQIPVGNIVNRSSAPSRPGSSFLGLRVDNGQNLLLLGGNVENDQGGLNAFGGRVEIGAVAGTGSVTLNANGNLSFPETLARGDVSFFNESRVEVRLNRGGDIGITARNIDVSDSSLLAGIDTDLGTTENQAGDVTLDATDAIRVRQSSRIFNDVEQDRIGDGGDLRLTAATVLVEDGSQLSASTFGEGDAGSVIINARDTVSLSGASIFNNIEREARGNGGQISITARSLSLTGGAQLQAGIRGASETRAGGQGSSGSINITAQDSVAIDGVNAVNSNVSGIFSDVEAGAVGPGGAINITTGSLSLTNGARLISSTSGEGDAGNIIIDARDTVSFVGTSADRQSVSAASSSVEEEGNGRGGNIDITTGVLVVQDGARLIASTSGEGDAGSVIINARDTVSFVGTSANGSSAASSSVEEKGNGGGGNIDITTGVLVVQDGAQLSASTSGEGDAGSVIINARDTVSFVATSAAFSSVEEEGKGQGGNIDITTGALVVQDGAQLIATTFGEGDAGSVIINARDTVSFVGRSADGQFPSAAFSSVEEGGRGQGGNIDITTGALVVQDGAQLIANTFGEGDAGSVIINARDTVSLDGVGENGFSSGIFSDAAQTASGRGNTISITTSRFFVSNGAVIDAGTANTQPGGNIVVTADDITLTNGGQLITATLSSGRAGNITLNAERVTLSGRDASFAQRLEEFGRGRMANEGNGASGLFANTRADSTGLGGRIVLNLDDLILSNGAQITARSQGSGAAGGVIIRASEAVTLNDRARISTQSQGENALAGDIQITADNTFTATDSDVTTSAANASGGDIRLTARDVRLFGDSDIRTNSARDGGNISVNADTIVTLDDSDIFASAAQGRGGNITLNTPAFFGSNYQPEASENAEVSELDNNSRVDLNATGTVSSGTISTPDTSFIQNSLSDLTENVVDTDSLIANSCIARTETGGTFLITGPGGLPAAPGSNAATSYPTGTIRTVSAGGEPEEQGWQPGDAIVEPQGVYRLPDGRLVLSRECS